MEEFQRLRESAKQRLQNAEHFLTVTYPRVEDPKLLLSALENLYQGYEDAMNAVLEYEQTFKNIDPLEETFAERFTTFEEDVAPEHGLDPEHITELRSVLATHEESPVEFPRGEKFVICDDDYVTETLTQERLKEYLEHGKGFWETVQEVTSEHEGIFG